jgi:hypothetical protein
LGRKLGGDLEKNHKEFLISRITLENNYFGEILANKKMVMRTLFSNVNKNNSIKNVLTLANNIFRCCAF